MPVLERCQFCTARPVDDVAVMRWQEDDRERLTLALCGRHLQRIQKAGPRGWEHQGRLHKIGWW